MEKIKRVLTQSEIQELREIIEYSEDNRLIELFKKFHATYNKLAIFYRDKRIAEQHSLYYEEQLYKSKEKEKKLEEELRKVKNRLDEEIEENVKLYKELQKEK